MNQLLRAGIGRTLLFLIGVSLLPSLFSHFLHVPFAVEVVPLVLLTAVVMDLAEEWSARRRHGALVPVWSLHQVAFLGPAVEALSRAGIPAHARAAYHRSLLWFFGPYVPIELLVPASRAEEAQQALDEILVADEVS